MEKLFGGRLVSYFTQLDVREEIWKGLPRTLSLALGAASCGSWAASRWAFSPR